MRPGAGSKLGKTPRNGVGFETIAGASVSVRQFSNHLAAEQGSLKPPCSFFILQFSDVGFAALELYAEAVPQVP